MKASKAGLGETLQFEFSCNMLETMHPIVPACSKIQVVNPSIDSLFFILKVGKVLESVFLEQTGSKNIVEDGSPKLIIFFRTRHIAHLIE